MTETGRVESPEDREDVCNCTAGGLPVEKHTPRCPVSAEGRVLPSCEACTGDGGRGHTMRGECMGAPCPKCGDARYRHLNGEHGIAVRETTPARGES